MILTGPRGRVGNSYRYLVTDQCILRCRYCMPPENIPGLFRGNILIDQDLHRIAFQALAAKFEEICITFYSRCNRNRIASLGLIKGCLFAGGVGIKYFLRPGDILRKALHGMITTKPARHNLTPFPPAHAWFSMALIGR
jgi:molybdenum cofactor biosynthesis enzyme MoaA